MSNKIIVSQILEDIANTLDKNGHHEIADKVTEDLVRLSENNSNIKTAFFRKLFRGVDKFVRKNLGGWGVVGGLLAQQLNKEPDQKKIYNEYLMQINTRQDLPGLKQRILADTKLKQEYKNQLIASIDNFLNRPVQMFGATPAQSAANMTVSTPPTMTAPQITPAAQTTMPMGLATSEAEQDDKDWAYYNQFLAKAKDPRTNIPALIQQLNASGMQQKYPQWYQQILNTASMTMTGSVNKPKIQPAPYR